MIKLTEVVARAGQYDPEKGKNSASYRLRDVFVNPAHVVTMRDDEDYNDRSNREQMIEGLNSNVRFTRLSLNVGGNTTIKCTVTGTPESVMQKFGYKV